MTPSKDLQSVDFHVHLAPNLKSAPAGVERRDGRLVVDDHAVGPSKLYKPDALIEYLDRCSLDTAVVSVPPPFYRQSLDAKAAGPWVRTINGGLLDAVEDSERLLPIAYLPLEHPELAIEEHQRVRELGRFVGYAASAGGQSASLADPALAPLWSALDEEQALILLHPGMSLDPRLEEFYLHNLLGNPMETSVAAAQLVFGDVLATHQAMRVLLVHCGGCVPDLVPRWQRGADTERPGLRPLTESPTEVVRRFWVDCLVHDPGAVDRAVDVFGDNHIVLGSDWPFPMGCEDPRELIAHRGEKFVETVAKANAARALYPKKQSTSNTTPR